jgi:prevent-host-death family protein
MMKTVSATEAKNRFGALLSDVADANEEIVIENHGRPRAVVLSYDRYNELKEAREQQRRRQAMDDLRQLREDVRARNLDLDDEAAEAIAEDLSQEAVGRLIERIRAPRIVRTG